MGGFTGSRRVQVAPVPGGRRIAPAALLVAAMLLAMASASVASAASGTVAAWGENRYGSLGDGLTTGPETCKFETPCSFVPVEVSGLTGVSAVTGGNGFNLALLSTGKVMAWGYNEQGDLGDGSTINRDVPVEVHGLSEVVAIGARYHGGLALLADGKVMAWGSNVGAALGNGSATGPETCTFVDFGTKEVPCSTTPVEVSGLSGVKAISSGNGQSSFAMLGNGSVMAWGDSGWLGNGLLPGEGTTTGPVEVGVLAGAKAIATAVNHNLAVMESGKVLGWGENGFGQLGTGTAITQSASPVQVSGLTTATGVAAGHYHSLAVLRSGKVMAWGSNGLGQLGDKKQKTLPSSNVPVEALGIKEAKAVAAGTSSSYALLGVGRVLSWGFNERGELGVGLNLSSSQVPIEITRLSEATAVSAGGESTESQARGSTVAIGTPAAGPPPPIATELGRCQKVTAGKGKFSSGTCTEPQYAGSFEWVPGAVKTGFVVKGGAGTLATLAGEHVSCKAESAKGKFEGSTGVSGVVLTFTGCTLSFGPTSCSSAGAGPEEIVTGPLEGGFVWEQRSLQKVALDLYPPGHTGPFMSFTCGSYSLQMRGSVLAPVTVDRMSLTNTLKYKAQGGEQKPSSYETPTGTKVKDSLKGFLTSEPEVNVGLTIATDTLTGEESLEVNAII
jgi:alpha-tubulin suppressor-like RCC1 family protein